MKLRERAGTPRCSPGDKTVTTNQLTDSSDGRTTTVATRRGPDGDAGQSVNVVGYHRADSAFHQRAALTSLLERCAASAAHYSVQYSLHGDTAAELRSQLTACFLLCLSVQRRRARASRRLPLFSGVASVSQSWRRVCRGLSTTKRSTARGVAPLDLNVDGRCFPTSGVKVSVKDAEKKTC